ncbi:uncharacterized protein MELLADRAFT_118530 [Melampsora larici-populina 98AG31]|uniref:Uncharacterized protein n=1 Tax=Melampsora larici-populina (strain 98AG31 / pathotype 3-4-7) TaxID=747676 RepID=F4SA84_MELLP|nr:uncharacterized protein MELLADRAFT_118530 [Melampsora larici-populina 98AG31]EGF98449.1 hypothetical protein MELLADRAFT_118530 [Melampsora larici-populina 98AG31]
MSSRNPGGSAESSKKRRVDDRGNNGDGDNDNSTDYGNETPDLGDDESDGELSAGEIEKRKRKKAAFRKEATESRRRDKTFANVADAPDAALALAGFGRCTFDWGAGYDTPWNSSMASIIISEWVKCFNSRGARAFGVVAKDNTQSNREELLRRWFTNKKTNYTQQKKDETLMQTEEGKKQVEANRTRAKKLVNRRRAKSNIYKARIGVTKAIFGEGSKEVKMLSQPEIHSEDDVNSEATCKIQLTWRSAELDTFISLTDQCIVGQEVVAAAHRAAQHLVDRGPYSTTPDFDVFPPKGFQRSLVSPTWLGNIPSVAVKNLKLTDDVVDIRQAIKRLTEELTKSSTPAA